MTSPNFLFLAPGRTPGTMHWGDTKSTRLLFDLTRAKVLNQQPFYGNGRIQGTVKVITVPAPARIVRLYERSSGLLARETLTDGTGAYSFTQLNRNRTYFVVAFDEVGGYNATIADFVVPAL